MIGFLVFQIYPFLASLVYSFTDLTMLKEPNWAGLKNYINIFTGDPTFVKSLSVTVVYVLISVPLKLLFALLVAMLLNMNVRGIGVFRTFYYLPSILGGSVGLSILWRYLFSHDGLINLLLSRLSLPAVDWLGNPDISLFTVSLLSVWQFGSSMVLFLAALKQIPRSYYEAAMVDGASRPRMFVKITVPLITPIVFFNLVMQMINAFQEFTGPYLITNGGPLKSTYMYSLMIYDTAFGYLKMGYACALSWILFVIIMAFTLMIFKSSAYWTYYEDERNF